MDEDREKARAYMASEGNPFRSAFTGSVWGSATAKAYGVHAIPRSCLLGPDGRVLQREVILGELLGDEGEVVR